MTPESQTCGSKKSDRKMVGNASLGMVCGAVLVALAVKVLNWVWFKPRRIERALRAQGLKGSRYRLFYGDITDGVKVAMEEESKPMALSHRITPRVGQIFYRSMIQYGKLSFTWFGPSPRVTLMDPELAREVLSNKFGHFQKVKLNPLGRTLVGGLAIHEGEKWAHHRRIINPAFHLEKLKCMLPAFSICCDELVNKWDKLLGAKGCSELDVWPEFQSLTADVISRTAFGTSFKEGRRIFQLQQELAELIKGTFQNLYIPGYRYLPTKKNNQIKEVTKEMELLLRGMIELRMHMIGKGETKHRDLLGLLLESNTKEQKELDGFKSSMSTEDVIEECKLFYFAGHETTSVLLTWTLIVLSMHPTWQTQARQEVLQVLGESKPDYDGLSKLKIVTMILYEVLRLYPPAIMLTRETYKEMKLGDFTFPRGVQLVLPILLMHHDEEFWGANASEFQPDRFEDGISRASKVPGAFFPFGGGPRVCIGQNFAMLEAKLALACLLQRFSFELSPTYIHAPHTVLTLHPQFGAQVIVHRLSC